MKKIISLCFLFNTIFPALSQGIGEIAIEPKNPSVNQLLKVMIQSSGELSNCGLQINLGDGTTKDIRVEKFPHYVDHIYPKEGVFPILVTGKLLIRGLGTVLPCSGDSKSIAVSVGAQNVRVANNVSSTPIQQATPPNIELEIQSNLPVCQGGDPSKWSNCFGSWTAQNGNKYVGEWKDGKPFGKGANAYTSGDKYIGEFKDGRRNGQGTYFFANGNKYVGELRDGKFNGQGTYTHTNGNKYIGEFKNDKPNGQGSTIVANGAKYIGEHEDGRFNGQGTYTFANGRVSLGEWKDGKPHGRFIEFLADKSIGRAGIFEEGKIIRAETINPAIFTRISSDLAPQLSNAQLNENQRLKTEAEEAKRKQAELEEQLRLAEQQSKPITAPTSSSMTNMVNRRALVIGNDTYKSVAKLLNAREDARAMASNLTSVGYQVTLKLDLNEKEMKAAIRTFANQVQGGDEVLFFFAGHGVQLGATNYLLPTDIGGESEAQVRDEAIQLQRILDDMSDRKAKFTLAMIDACRDNPFKSSGRAIGGRGLAPTTAATGQMVIFSAGTGQQALDKLNNADKNKNGLFTRVFIQEMQKPSQSIDRVVKNVRNQVAELAKSVGHEQVPAIYDQVLGDFYFKK